MEIVVRNLRGAMRRAAARGDRKDRGRGFTVQHAPFGERSDDVRFADEIDLDAFRTRKCAEYQLRNGRMIARTGWLSRNEDQGRFCLSRLQSRENLESIFRQRLSTDPVKVQPH